MARTKQVAKRSLSKRKFEMTNNEDAVVEGRRWEALNVDILALIFVKIQPANEMVRCVPFVCKPWMEVVAGPYCWLDLNLLSWCQRVYGSNPVEVDPVVEKLVRRSNYTVQQLGTFGMGLSGFLSVVNCGRCLKVLHISRSSINDDMVLKHIKPLPNLEVLNISYCLNITYKGIAAFGNHCKSLVHLRRHMPYFHFVDLDDSEAKTIAHTMPSLKHIELLSGQFSDSGLSEILTECKLLTHLDIHGSRNVKLNLGGDVAKILKRLGYFRCHNMNNN